MIPSKNHLILLYFFNLYVLCQGTITQTPTAACVGDRIVVSCVLNVPGAGDTFLSALTSFIVGTSDTLLPASSINDNASHPGVDLSRLGAGEPISTDNTMVSGTITLFSYLSSDEGLRLGCSAQYLISGTSNRMFETETLSLNQSGLPSISTPIATIQNFNPSTCEGTLRFNLAATSDRDITSYSILFNGSSITSNLPSSNTEFTHNTQFLLNINYPTSIIATSCAGSSIDGDASLRVNGYMQSDVSCARYNNVTGALTIDWTLSTPSQPTGVSGISIVYSVRVTYSHCNGTVTYLLTNTSNFNLMSTITTYDVPLTAHNFTNPLGVETNITAHVRIIQQCGQDLVGTEFSCSIRSVTASPDIPTSSTISPSSSISSSSSSISIPISPTLLVTTPTPTLTTTTSTTSTIAAGISPAIIGGAIGGIILILLILVLLLILLGVCIYFVKKRDQEPKESDRFNMRGFEGNQSKESVDGQPDATYSQVNKPPKAEQPLYADIKKPQKELLYADLEHVAPASGLVMPPTVPSTHYADLAQFSHSEQTTYATVQDTKY